jgi:hypothetical protein
MFAAVNRQGILAAYRLGFALLTLVAVAVELLDLVGRGVLNPINFFSYFTIQSDVIGAAVFLVGAARWRSERSPGFDLVRGASVLSLTVTLVVFALLLSGTDVDTAIPWVNSVVHQIFPIVVIADWFIDPPVRRIGFRQGLVWLVYPLAWLGYTLVRGPIAGWYPYPFLDPANGGYGTVAVYVIAILIFGGILCGILAPVGNAVSGRMRPTLATGT